MAVATTTRAEFLKAVERSETSASATLKARWGDAGGDTAQSSLLVSQGDATTELARQMALLSAGLAQDSIDIEGLYFDLEGTTVRLDYAFPGGNAFGGPATVDMLVVRATINLREGFTTLEGFIAL